MRMGEGESVKFIDFFSGIGGFRLGMERAGHECMGHCEIDKYADKSYRAMHDVKEDEWYANDITAVESGDLPDADCYCGGFPCQSFSIAGKRGGFDDTRGTLFFEVMRLARVRKPKYLFLENVKGLLSHDGGRTFGTIIQTLWESGYDAEWQICNSKNFGVPQNRERVFIVGYLRGERGGQVFPVSGTYGTPVSQLGNIIEGSAWDNPQAGRIYSVKGSSPCLNTMQGGGREPKVLIPAKVDKPSNDGSFGDMQSMTLEDVGGQTAGCLASRDYKGIRRGFNVVMVKEATKKGYAEAEIGDSINLALPDSETRRGRVGKGIANTLDTSCNQGTLIGSRIRKLIPRECFRLQGFPDDYFDRAATVNSDSQLYKQAGNSVTVNVIHAIAERLK